MKIIKADKWVPANNIKLESNAEKGVRSDFNTLILAGPGAGKTELLAQRACFLLQTNTCKYAHKILAISFKRDAAYNLKERVTLRCGEELGLRFDSFTFDAFAKQILDRFRNALPSEYAIKGDYDIIDYQTLKDAYRDEDELLYQTTTKLDKFHTHGSLPYLPGDTSENVRIKVWKKLLKSPNSKLTFPMIMRLAEHILKSNPKIKEYLQQTYHYVFLDEFQDTTFLQYAFFKECFSASKIVFTAVGDDKQRIMLWADANPKIFEVYVKEQKAQVLALKMNFRSAPRLVALQNHLIQYLLNKKETVTADKRWPPDSGEAAICMFKNPDKEKEFLLQSVKKWLDKEGLKPRDICILVKQQLEVYAGSIIEYLNANGIQARDENYLQDMLTDEVSNYIFNMIFCILRAKGPEEKAGAFSFLSKVTTEFEDRQLLNLDRKLYQFINACKAKYAKIKDEKDIRALIDEIIEFANQVKICAAFPIYKSVKFLRDTIEGVKKELVNRFEQSKKLEIALESLIGRDSIPVMTIHKSKGLEYHTVLFVGLEDGAFWSFAQQPEEDTCAFFVAMSRAKEQLIFTFSEVRTDKYGNVRNQSNEKIKVLFDELSNSGLVDILNP